AAARRDKGAQSKRQRMPELVANRGTPQVFPTHIQDATQGMRTKSTKQHRAGARQGYSDRHAATGFVGGHGNRFGGKDAGSTLPGLPAGFPTGWTNWTGWT